MDHLRIEALTAGQPYPFDLLLLADPSVELIHRYLKNGKCYIARLQEDIIGVVVLKEITPSNIEIKNIAIAEPFQRKGFGRQLLLFAENVSREMGYSILTIGTGNSSLSQLALYQKQGFEMTSIRKDFFIKYYDQPILENGIPCKHLVVLEKSLLSDGEKN